MAKETNPEDLSTEELIKLKEAQIKLMTDNMEALAVQDKYSFLKANIAENTLREHMSKVKLATMLAGPEPEKKKRNEGN